MHPSPGHKGASITAVLVQGSVYKGKCQVSYPSTGKWDSLGYRAGSKACACAHPRKAQVVRVSSPVTIYNAARQLRRVSSGAGTRAVVSHVLESW